MWGYLTKYKVDNVLNLKILSTLENQDVIV